MLREERRRVWRKHRQALVGKGRGRDRDSGRDRDREKAREKDSDPHFGGGLYGAVLPDFL